MLLQVLHEEIREKAEIEYWKISAKSRSTALTNTDFSLMKFQAICLHRAEL